MAKKNYVVRRSGTYGKRGSVIERDFGKDGLSDRQKVLLEVYKKPVVQVDNSEEVKELKAENKKLKAELSKLKDEKPKTDNK